MNKILIGLLLILIASIVAPSQILARNERIILNLHDSFFRGTSDHPAPIYLKRELKQRYPRLNLHELQLKKVVLTAKSRKGRGHVRLRIGQNFSRADRIAGSHYLFNDHRQFTFHRLRIKNPSSDSQGVWQLLFTGNIVVREVKLVFYRKHTYKDPYWFNSDRNRYDTIGHRPYQQTYPQPHTGPYDYRQTDTINMILQARSWGTPMEGENSCNTKTSNAPDGWDAPQNICHNSKKTRYTHGYRPVKLYIRPETSSLQNFSNFHYATKLMVSITAISRNPAHHRHETATFGIDISGRTHTSHFSLAPTGTKEGKQHTQSFVIKGKWSINELNNAVIWLLPNQSSADFKIKSMHLKIVRGS